MIYASYFFGAVLFIYKNGTPALFHRMLEELAIAGTVSRPPVYNTGSGFFQSFEKLAQFPRLPGTLTCPTEM